MYEREHSAGGGGGDGEEHFLQLKIQFKHFIFLKVQKFGLTVLLLLAIVFGSYYHTVLTDCIGAAAIKNSLMIASRSSFAEVAPIPCSRSSEPKRGTCSVLVLVLVVQNLNEVGRNMLTHVVKRDSTDK